MHHQGTKKRRLCLFAGYDKDKKIDDYVIYYINELSKLSEVYYCADCELKEEELQKLSAITKGAYAHRHKEYDFGSWKYILNHIGWDKISEYEEILLVNDSCFGPIFPLQEVFEKMDSQGLEAWSMAKNKFLMSFFVVIKASLFQHPRIKEFFDNIKPEGDKNLVIKKYERGFSQLLMELSPKTGGYITGEEVKQYWKAQKNRLTPRITKQIGLIEKFFIKIKGDRIRLYDDDILLLAEMRFPLLKKIAVMSEEIISPQILLPYLQENSLYPVDLIPKYQARIGFCRPSMLNIFYLRLKRQLKSFIYEKKYKRDVKITRIFKITVHKEKLNLQ